MPQRYKIDPTQLFLRLIVLVIILAAIIFGGYKGLQYIQQRHSNDPQAVITSVGKLIELPAGETPTVATVSDLTPLAGQEFFKDAQIGDKVLIFSKSKRAILYRPSENRIIVAAPLNN